MTREGKEAIEGGNGSESVDDLFREIWERESQPELRFGVRGVLGSVRRERLSSHGNLQQDR